MVHIDDSNKMSEQPRVMLLIRTQNNEPKTSCRLTSCHVVTLTSQSTRLEIVSRDVLGG